MPGLLVGSGWSALCQPPVRHQPPCAPATNVRAHQPGVVNKKFFRRASFWGRCGSRVEGGGEIMMASSGQGKLIELNKRRPKRAKVVSQVCSDGKHLNARAVSQKQCNFFLSFNERESNFVAEQVQFFWHSVRVGTSLIFLLHVSLITHATDDLFNFALFHLFDPVFRFPRGSCQLLG